MAEIGFAAPAPAPDMTAAFDPAAYVVTADDGTAALNLLVENMHCAGCMQRIETALTAAPEVLDARVNLTTRRLRLRWTGDAAGARGLVDRVAALGYRLVPFDASEAAGDAEGRALLRSLAVAGFAAGNVMLLSVAVWAGAFSDMGPATRGLMHWISALIVLPAVAWAGRPFFRPAFAALAQRRLNMDVPISLALALTAAMSLFETARGGPHAYFDACAMLLFFLLLGRVLDHQARARMLSAAERMSLLTAATARVIGPDGDRRLVPARELRPAMRIEIAAGERIAADGTVIEGTSDVDTSLVTGESIPRPVSPGGAVHAGTVNLAGRLLVEIAAAADNTVLAEIVRLIEAAEQRRDRYVRIADRAARIYAPAVHLAALATFIGWTAVAGLGWQPALMIAVSVLIITCPCALGLAVPAVQVVACGRLLGRGILVKQPDGLERLAAADIAVFDKTGTLTLAEMTLARPDPAAGRALGLAAALAASSRHPLCRALAASAHRAETATGVQETPGMGLAGSVGGQALRLGSRAWCGVPSADGEDDGRAELWLAGRGRSPVRFAFEARLRPDAARCIERLRQAGLAVALMSGDRPATVRALAAAVGIDDWQGGCSPADKAARLAELAAAGHRVLMVGDGLNDAPALAGAHVSMSPAEAADISRTAADFVFQGASLAPVADALAVARRARRLVFGNFALAAGYNAVAVPLAAAGMVTPLIAAIAMSASSLVVTLNALRLRLAHIGDRP